MNKRPAIRPDCIDGPGVAILALWVALPVLLVIAGATLCVLEWFGWTPAGSWLVAQPGQ